MQLSKLTSFHYMPCPSPPHPAGPPPRPSPSHCLCRLHVDAAWAGAFAMLPEMDPYFASAALVDSWNTNPHKALLANFGL